jgi:hypothetical protein
VDQGFLFLEICLVYGLAIQVADKGYGVAISFATYEMYDY